MKKYMLFLNLRRFWLLLLMKFYSDKDRVALSQCPLLYLLALTQVLLLLVLSLDF